MTAKLHPLLHTDSSVKPAQGPQSFKLSRGDMRTIELDSFIAGRMADELHEQKQIGEKYVKAGLPEIHVSPYEGHLLSALLKLMSAKRGVEVGTLGGYSTSWICRALENVEGAHLDSLELSPKFAAVARENLQKWRGIVDI